MDPKLREIIKGALVNRWSKIAAALDTIRTAAIDRGMPPGEVDKLLDDDRLWAAVVQGGWRGLPVEVSLAEAIDIYREVYREMKAADNN